MGAVSVAVQEVGNIVAIGEPKSVVEEDMLWSFYGVHPLCCGSLLALSPLCFDISWSSGHGGHNEAQRRGSKRTSLPRCSPPRPLSCKEKLSRPHDRSLRGRGSGRYLLTW
jgi:hypothetical protein